MSHPSLTSDRVGNVLCISVDDGKANAFSPSLLVAMSQELADAEADAQLSLIHI